MIREIQQLAVLAVALALFLWAAQAAAGLAWRGLPAAPTVASR
jgi:hypothetical protein